MRISEKKSVVTVNCIAPVVFLFMLYCVSLSTHSAQSGEQCHSGNTSITGNTLSATPLPVRQGSQIKTSGSVPHVQIGVQPNSEINKTLLKLAFALPELEQRPTIVSLAGAVGMNLGNDVPVAHPKAIVRGREFAHIHTDGSLHAPLPYARAIELEEKGWGERHPWADTRDGWDGLVMLYSANTNEELKILLQLITESYNHVTGRSVSNPAC